jgi:hypothetical protein
MDKIEVGLFKEAIMTYRVGDSSFTRDGRASVVVSRDKAQGSVEVEKEGKKFNQTRRIGYINGLDKADRSDFNNVVKEVREKETPKDRLDYLQKTITDIGDDPKKRILKRYLEGELTFLMNSTGVKPKTYPVQVDQLVK